MTTYTVHKKDICLFYLIVDRLCVRLHINVAHNDDCTFGTELLPTQMSLGRNCP